jgi:UPF0755 protein
MQYSNNRKTLIAAALLLTLFAGLGIYTSGLFSRNSRSVSETNLPSDVATNQKTDSAAITETEIPSQKETPPVSDKPAEIAKSDEPTPVVSKPVQKSQTSDIPAQKPQNTDPVAIASPMETERFAVPPEANAIDQVADSLAEQGFIKNKDAFKSAFTSKELTINPGGYKLSKEMSVSQIAEALRQKPYMKWVVIPEGLRKEEIAALLCDALGWTQNQKNLWITTYTKMKFDNIEGVYFPDTYLIPVDESPIDVASRLIAKFNEKFAVYLPEFNSQNIKWTTGLTLASIVQREAANDAEMPLIAGILWNRLNQSMALNVDATLQYVRGDVGKGWWAPITVADKQTESPYNTYKNKGLPPHPICNPGIPAIEAVLTPAQTDCLYYLHGKDGQAHCSKTYEEHQKNIEQYLK